MHLKFFLITIMKNITVIVIFMILLSDMVWTNESSQDQADIFYVKILDNNKNGNYLEFKNVIN